MTLKSNIEYTNYYFLDYENARDIPNISYFRNNHEQEIRKKYHLSDSIQIVVKQGTILKENSGITQRERLIATQTEIDETMYNNSKNNITKMHNLIDKAIEKIEILEIQNNIQEMNKHLLHEEINSEAKKLFIKLSDHVKELTEKTYKKF